MVETLVEEGCIGPPDSATTPVSAVVTGVHDFIAATSSELVIVQAEDLVGERVGVNLPGTDTERPNWRRKLPEPVETLLSGNAAQAMLSAMRKRGRGRGS